MQYEGLGGAIFLAVLLAFVVLGGLAVRRMRRRRLGADDGDARARLEAAVGAAAASGAPSASDTTAPPAAPAAAGAAAASTAPAVSAAPAPPAAPAASAALAASPAAAGLDAALPASGSAAPAPAPGSAAPAPGSADASDAAATAAAADVPAPAAPEDTRLRAGLARTHTSLQQRLAALFGRHPGLDPALLEGLEEALLLADVGVGLTARLLDALRARPTAGAAAPTAVRAALAEQMEAAFAGADATVPAPAAAVRPRVILFVGVNGVGKTTTVGKLAYQMQQQGQRVLLAAADTFRAAAAEQLAVWAERANSELVRGAAGADPASVVFDAIAAAQARAADVVLVDTAGRLHTKVELMDEIKKVRRAAGKARAGAPDETWLVVDATTGQNALQQAREFHQALGLSGVILTKLDGTARGGVVVAIADVLQIPVRYVGVGEQAEDLRPFAARPFVAALLGD